MVYVARSVVYDDVSDGTFTQLIGDGSTSQGGTPPAYANQPAAIASNFDTSTFLQGGGPFPPGVTDEAKFRITLSDTHGGTLDPILDPGNKNFMHHHTFWGNDSTDENSTFSSLRLAGNSTSTGGAINRTAYWRTSLMVEDAFGVGKDAALRADDITVYYSVATDEIQFITRIPRGFKYVFGYNPHDPHNSTVAAEIAAANARPGNAFAFASVHSDDPDPFNGFVGWFIEDNSMSKLTQYAPRQGRKHQPYIRDADGNSVFSIVPGDTLVADFVAPAWWDGHNLDSPNGRDHLRQSIKWGSNYRVGPQGWWRLPTLTITLRWEMPDQAYLNRLYCSSDRMAGVTHHGHAFNPGETMHADWFGAWDDDFFKAWQKNCTGCTIDGAAGSSGDCGDGKFGDGTKGLVQADIRKKRLLSANERYLPVKGKTTGPFTMNMSAPVV